MFRRADTVVAGALLVALAACAPPNRRPTVTTSGSTTVPATTNTTAPSTSIVATTMLTPLPAVEPLPTLADGRPSSFVGVTSDYLAVAADTVSGELVAVLGQSGSAAELADAECAACVNVVDGVWRTADGAFSYVSECCEPAAGVIHVIPAGGALDEDPVRVIPGWSVAPSPRTQEVLVVGYIIELIGPGTEMRQQLSEDDGSAGMNSSAWYPDSNRVAWIDQREEGMSLVTHEIATKSESLVPLPWADVGQTDWDLGIQASGRLVTFRGSGTDDAEGVVFAADGGIVATFPVEPGSRMGGYDRTGRFLLYVDGEGVVRWQGLGRAGVLAEGFLAASW